MHGGFSPLFLVFCAAYSFQPKFPYVSIPPSEHSASTMSTIASEKPPLCDGCCTCGWLRYANELEPRFTDLCSRTPPSSEIWGSVVLEHSFSFSSPGPFCMCGLRVALTLWMRNTVIFVCTGLLQPQTASYDPKIENNVI